MATAKYRFDYAKFLWTGQAEMWNHFYRAINETSHERKYKGEWLKSHKTQRLWFNPETKNETWSLEIWGEWAGIVEVMSASNLFYLKRLDVRAIIWEASEEAIIEVGQHLQRSISTTNINVYATKPRTKRGGRDAGGKGFSIGSHKSDLRVTCYKRTGEPCAQEYQCSGAMLKNMVDRVNATYNAGKGTIDAWALLRREIEEAGAKRLAQVFNRAGISTYWPTFAREGVPELPPIQAQFIPSDADWQEYEDWARAVEENIAEAVNEKPIRET